VDAEVNQLLSLVGPNTGSLVHSSTLMSDRSSVSYAGQMYGTATPIKQRLESCRCRTPKSVQCDGTGIVADIDTGVDPGHPVFQGVLLPGYDSRGINQLVPR